MPSIKSLGLKYLWGKTWDPVHNIYGGYPFLIGTLLTSFIALIISIPFSLAIAIYLGEYKPRGWLSNFLSSTIELIAAVPSVIYGFWGILILVPIIRNLETKWNAHNFSEYRTYEKSDNSFVINGKTLDLTKDYFPFSYSGVSNVEGTIIRDTSTLSDSSKQGHPWFLDLKSELEGNKNNPSFKIDDYIKEKTEDDFNKGAGALVIYNSSSIADKIQFNKKDTSTSLDIPVVYVTPDAFKKYFFNTAANYDANMQVDVVVKDPWNIDPYGYGIFTAALILSIMIIPYSASLGREMIRLVPSSLKEGAYSLGATRFEVLKNVIWPYTKSGIFAGILLSLGRALGETMAVTMVIGNTSLIPKNIFAEGNTMASVIANEFTEADHTMYYSALIELGLLLFLVTVAINMAGKRIIKRFTSE